MLNLIFNVLLAENWILPNPEWKEDTMPEIMDGKNVADFIDPDILEKLEALEREEEKLEAEGFYDSEGEMVSRVLYIPSVLVLKWHSSTPTTSEKPSKRRMRSRRSSFRRPLRRR